ncbi:uncharacterized protein LOC124411739 [Diprion similis]|uniref:uncharacterized protein LOC124411739 n=1 Tax=Diprion similis TaxID=362088 RepID=UPI001EF95112|nr:uncharacterized protein LOC124411739 [Diprion similis]
MAKYFIFVVTTFLIVVSAVQAQAAQSGCNCAVFPMNSQTPIIEQSLQYNVSCDEEGAEICSQLCVALAQGAKDKAPAMICEKFDSRASSITPAVFARSCGSKDEWKFTGLKSPEPICCRDGKESACGDSDTPI